MLQYLVWSSANLYSPFYGWKAPALRNTVTVLSFLTLGLLLGLIVRMCYLLRRGARSNKGLVPPSRDKIELLDRNNSDSTSARQGPIETQLPRRSTQTVGVKSTFPSRSQSELSGPDTIVCQTTNQAGSVGGPSRTTSRATELPEYTNSESSSLV